MKRFVICIAVTGAFLLSGCQNIKSRECPAFDHPSARQWQPVESGNSVVFTNQDGDSAVYLLRSITLSEPYTARTDINSSSLDKPICITTAEHVFVAEDDSHEIIFNFKESDTDGGDPLRDFLQLKLEVTLPAAVTGESGQQITQTQTVNLLALSTDATEVGDDALQPLFVSNQTLENGQTYTDVIAFPGISLPPDPDYEQYSLSKVLLSRNVGLIQVSRNDGGVFTLVPE